MLSPLPGSSNVRGGRRRSTGEVSLISDWSVASSPRRRQAHEELVSLPAVEKKPILTDKEEKKKGMDWITIHRRPRETTGPGSSAVQSFISRSPLGGKLRYSFQLVPEGKETRQTVRPQTRPGRYVTRMIKKKT